MPDDPQLLPEAPAVPPPVAPLEEPPEWRRGHEDPPWTIVEALAILALSWVVANIVILITVLVVARVRGGAVTTLGRDPQVVVLGEFLSYLIIVAALCLYVRDRAGGFLRGIRWQFPSRRFATYVVAGLVLSVLVQVTSRLLPIPKSLPIEHLFRTARDAWIMSVFGCTVAPFVEELLFRGILYPALARRLGVTIAVGITGLGFAALHAPQLGFSWAPVLMLVMVGVVLTLVRARTGSVGASFLVHAAYNLTIFFILWLGTDHFRHMEKMTS